MKIKKRTLVSLLCLVATLAISIPFAPTAKAVTTVYVPDDYPSIQAAVDAANAGDTIIVRDGTYAENVQVNKTLTIRSESGAPSTVVEATNLDGPIFYVTAGHVEIDGFTVKGKHKDWTNGIQLAQTEYCTIRNIRALNNEFAISLVDSSFCLILNNDVADNSYGIDLWDSVCNIVSTNSGGLIRVISSNGNIIEANNVSDIQLLTSSSYNTLTRNTVSPSESYIHGVTSSDSNQNKIYLNNFIGTFHSQGNNIWNSPKMITYNYSGNTFQGYLGNYWLFHASTDSDDNGVYDSSFNMGEVDSYPLAENIESFIVERPIDTVPPETQITNVPETTIDYNDITIGWIGSDDTSSPSELVYCYYLEDYDFRWRCTVDMGAEYNDLRNGEYTFKVKARDESGNIDPTPAEISFKVSTRGQIETIDTEGDVGWHSSLAFDILGNPGISYSDATKGYVKFAYWNGSSWEIKIVTAANYYGTYTSLAFDSLGNPAISYLSNQNLQYAHWNGTAWDIETVDNDDEVGAYSSLAFDKVGNPAISYYLYSGRYSGPHDLRYAHFNGTSWDIETIDSEGETGRYTSLAFDSSGNPAISYISSELRYAHFNGASWDIEMVDSGNQIVYCTSLAFDRSGNPSVAYCVYTGVNYHRGEIKCALWNGTSWDLDIVEDLGEYSEGTSSSGEESPSIAFNGSGWPALSYYDRINKVLKYAHFTGTAWSINVVDNDRDVGQFSSLCFDQLGNPAISYYDKSNGNLKFIWTAGANQPPKRPSNIKPIDGRAVISLPVTLESSTFSDPNLDTHIASQWQITITLGDYSNPIFDSKGDAEHLTSITIPEGILSYDTTYYWRVRHQDDKGAWSEWSEDTSFNTKLKLYVPDDYPTIQAAVDAASPDHTIIVRDGTYIENLRIYKSLTLQSENGPDTTIVQAANPNINVVSICSGTTEEGSTQGDNVSLSGFTVNGGKTGIRLCNVFYCTISNNKVNSNKDAGIFVDCPGYNVITENDLSNNEGCGIKLDSTYNNTIANNRISSNGQYGIYLIGGGWLPPCINNRIYLNNFMNNASNIGGLPKGNFWNSPGKMGYMYEGKAFTNYLGNFWDDYVGGDTDEDGIGDTPYNIDSDADNYPLMEPFENYETQSDAIPPATVADLSIKEVTANGVTLSWTAPGDDGNQGTASQYDIRYSTSEITEANWASAIQASGEPTPKPGGSSENFTVTGLAPGTTYYFALITADEVPNWSGLSNVATGITIAEGAKPVITSPLTIVASRLYYPYFLGDTLAATFRITNKGSAPITFDTLVVGGRVDGTVVDFEKANNIVLSAGDSYDYIGALVLPKAGTYNFFCAYHTVQHIDGEDENNWNIFIPVELNGTLIQDFTEAEQYRAIGFVVIEQPSGTVISAPRPNLWQSIHGPWENTPSGTAYRIVKIAADPTNVNNLYVVVRYAKYDGWKLSEDIFNLSNGAWQKISNGLPYIGINAIEIAPSNPNVVYIGGNTRGIYKYSEGSWASLGGPKSFWVGNYSVQSLAIDSSDPNTVYIGTEYYGLWKKKGNEDWKAVISSNDALFVNVVTADPQIAGTVYSSGYTNQAFGEGEVHIEPSGLLKSEDGGSTWQNKPTHGANIQMSGIVVDVAASSQEKKTVYAALGSYGYAVPIIGLKNVEKFVWPVRSRQISRFDGVGDWSNEASWHDATGKDGRNPLPDKDPKSIAVHPLFPNMVFASFLADGVYFSPDSGNNWFPILKKWWEEGNGEGKFIYGMLLAHDQNSQVLYVLGSDGILKLSLSDTDIIMKQHSSTELRIYDSQGHVTGVVNGQYKEEIPNSLCADNDTVVLLSPSDSYSYDMLGLDLGFYGLDITYIIGENTTSISATEIPISINTLHQYSVDWNALSQGQQGVTIQIDSDGDGTFEETVVTSPPYIPREPSPSNGATGVLINSTLGWIGGDPDQGDNVTYKVYMGTNNNPPLVSNNVTGNSFDPGTLNYNTMYYWKVVARDNYGITTEGPIWSFTTLSQSTSSGGGGGGGGGGPSGTTSLAEYITGEGKFVVDATAESIDGKVILDIPKGTVGKNRNGQRLYSISIKENTAPPVLPADCNHICLTYDIGPSGATFDPPIYLTFKYSDSQVPTGVAEENLVLATWQDGKWVECEGCVIDPIKNTITITVSHFSTFTAMAYTSPASFEVSGMTITPNEVYADETVTISATITNTGDLTGSYNVILKINDLALQTKEVILDGGGTQTISFSLTPDTSGKYTVDVNGLLSSFTVKEPEPKGTVAEIPAPEPPSPSPTPEALIPSAEKPITTVQPEKEPEVPVQTPVEITPSQVIAWWLIVIYVVCGIIMVGLGTYFFLRRRSTVQ